MIFILFLKIFVYAWGTQIAVPTQKVFGIGTAPYLEYPCFIAGKPFL